MDNEVKKPEDKKSDLLTKLMSSVQKPKPYIHVCKVCGAKFAVDTDEEEYDTCLRCKVKQDMKLNDDVIININILKLWENKKYDKLKGIDPILCGVAEGVILLDKEVENRDHLSVIRRFRGTKENDKIERYIKNLRYRMNGKYDAIVVLRFNTKEGFTVFCVRFSDRIINILEKKSVVFKKTFAISLVVKNYLKGMQVK
jgi:hypothetical protein